MRGKSAAELKTLVLEKRREQFNARMQLGSGQGPMTENGSPLMCPVERLPRNMPWASVMRSMKAGVVSRPPWASTA